MYTFARLSIYVPRGCFPPNLISTDALLLAALRKVQSPVGDMGTGVGSLALAVSALTGFETVGTDTNITCLKAARINAIKNRVYHLFHPVACDLLRAIRDSALGSVVANPPYLPLDPADPLDTLTCCGHDLKLYKEALKEALRVVRPGGSFVFSASSLTASRIEGARKVLSVWAGLDKVLIYECKRPD